MKRVTVLLGVALLGLAVPARSQEVERPLTADETLSYSVTRLMLGKMKVREVVLIRFGVAVK